MNQKVKQFYATVHDAPHLPPPLPPNHHQHLQIHVPLCVMRKITITSLVYTSCRAQIVSHINQQADSALSQSGENEC